ncbi:hypothetical protein J1605_014404 [Eschrichtius robustus]|uniref:Uncharacterized protein n=1 Tax=Eschrichtius robustus TaxID=9764 RepID=A0AB34GGK8_ESCRO|nr:hypothetical protein J1605_014404 [Eschrichtius robustus]
MGTRMLGDLSEHLGDMYGIQSSKGNGCGSDKGSVSIPAPPKTPRESKRDEEVQAARWGWGAPGTQTQAALPLGLYRSRFCGTCCSSSLDTWTVHSRSGAVCSYAALRDALVLQADAFSGRGARAVFERFTRGNGIVVPNGQRWRTLRNFALGALTEFGLGTRTIRDSVLEEAPCLLGEFQDSVGTAWSEKDRDLLWVWPLDTCCGCGLGKALGWNEASKPKGWVGAEPQAFDLVMFPLPGAPFDPWRLLDNAVSHVMCSVVFENRYGYEDPEFLRFLDLFNDNFRIMSSRWGEEQKGPESHFQETLVITTHNHFFGSTETTSTTPRCGLLILLKHPEVAGL